MAQPALPTPRRRGRRGRPPLGRARSFFRVRLEPDLMGRLQDLALDAGLGSTGPLVENLLGAAHGYVSPWAPKVALEQLGIDAHRLREWTSRMEATDCPEARPAPPAFGVRLDDALARTVMLRCDELDVSYTAYISSVLRHALTASEPGPPQLQLVHGVSS